MPFDAPSQWTEWCERLCPYRIATRLHKDDGDIQVSSSIYAMGRQAQNIFKSFRFESLQPSDIDPVPVDPKDDFDVVSEKFEQYFVPIRNSIHERALFYQRSQQPGESVEAFVRSLHEHAAQCRFEEKESEHVRDRLISGMLDKDMSQKLQLEQENVTLEKPLDSARHWELVKSQNESQVNFLTKGYNQKKIDSSSGMANVSRHQTEDSQLDVSAANVATCIDHQVQMLAQQNWSNAINLENGHFWKMCRKSAKTINTRSKRSSRKWRNILMWVNQQRRQQSCVQSRPWPERCQMSSRDIHTGLGNRCVSDVWQQLQKKMRPRSSFKTVQANLNIPGSPLNCRGQFIAKATMKGTVYHFRVIVVENDVENLLSRGGGLLRVWTSWLNSIL